jgi:hypothetical protein
VVLHEDANVLDPLQARIDLVIGELSPKRFQLAQQRLHTDCRHRNLPSFGGQPRAFLICFIHVRVSSLRDSKSHAAISKHFSLKSAHGQRALHARLAMTRQITHEVIFSRLLEDETLPGDLAAFACKRKLKAGKKRPCSVSPPLLPRMSVTARPAITRTFADINLNSVETILTSNGSGSLEGT